jgi:formylglycine-generating enzyme required for sulfatase activity/nitrate/TMAO reductase-like tetraheme cytochrome c subunit
MFKKLGNYLRKRILLILFISFVVGILASIFGNHAIETTSTDKFCASCHVHPHVFESWKLSTHYDNKGGIQVHCVDCHLPPKGQGYLVEKTKLGLKDIYGYLFKDSAEFNWEMKSELEHAVKYIPNASCKHCHQNLFPKNLVDAGIAAHLYYENNEKKLDLQCISCHLDVGHYNPNYKHGKMTGIPGQADSNTDSSKPAFEQAASVTTFADYTEQIPGTSVSFKMIAIKGGTFSMGSPEKEPFHQADESPVRQVMVSPFFMAEVETTWEEYWAFYGNTMSEGRTPPEQIYANNSNPNVDAISGPTPPYGRPDQNWGFGKRPAITMTHYAAETFCQWLSKKTGKKYRLPTESEWEYAARGGTETPYFFDGKPNKFSNKGLWRKFSDADTDPISQFIIYANNGKGKTHLPEEVKPNPFGLKNMLGNVMEYCADRYAPDAYDKNSGKVANPLATEGDEWVVRGGNYSSDAADVRAAARDHSQHDAWLKTDPQQPKSIWWYSDVKSIGFRVVCEPDNSIKIQ